MCAHLKTHRVLQPRHLWKQYRYNIDSQKKKMCLKNNINLHSLCEV